MGNKKEGIPKGFVSPAVNVVTGTVERSINNIQGDDNKPEDRQAYDLSYLDKAKRKDFLFVPESGPMDNQLY
jgi:hypothetical protein